MTNPDTPVSREAMDLARRVREMVRAENAHARAIERDIKAGRHCDATTSRDDVDLFHANLYKAWPAKRLDALIAALSSTEATPAQETSGTAIPGMQHVAYFDEGAFHWMSGIAPRDCELYAKRTPKPSPPATSPATREAVARLLAETAVTKNPRSFGFERSERYTTDAVGEIVERTWRNFMPEAEALAALSQDTKGEVERLTREYLKIKDECDLIREAGGRAPIGKLYDLKGAERDLRAALSQDTKGEAGK